MILTDKHKQDGRMVMWSVKLQELCDKDESMKLKDLSCPRCRGTNFYNSWDELNNFCGDCGQRIEK
jgi:ribosomal protein S27AE